MNLEDWITTGELAQTMKVSERTIRRMIARGEIEARRFGPRMIRVNRATALNAAKPLAVVA